MKKIVFLLFLIITVLLCLNNNKSLLIPSNAIRIRIIANSNDIIDQKEKIVIKDEINSFLFEKLKDVNNYETAKKTINNNLNNIKKIIENHTNNYTIYFGNNYFPEKEYKGTKYKEGSYESLVINLGEAKGNNYWCVLFPPICMIDEEKYDDVTYDLYVKQLLNKIN